MAKRSKKDSSKGDAKTTYAAGKHVVLPDANENVIVHLNVPTNSEETAAAAYNTMSNFAFLDDAESVSAIEEPVFDARYNILLEEFSKKTDVNDWPTQTSVCCHWCCHPFDTTPVALPFGIHHTKDDDKYQVHGCFCSFQCAAAYNFEHTNDVDGMWEAYALLNCMYHESVQDANRLIPAPSRQTLKMFGGYLTIDEFRNKSIGDGNFVNVLRSPMVFVPPQVEEINEANISHPLKFIPVDQDRINKVREKLQLKRTKPLIDSKHTLDHIMNLRITSDES